MISSIIFFFVMAFGLGIGLIKLLNLKFENSIESKFMSIAFGLASFPVLAIIFNFLHIPLNWIIFLVLAIIGIIFALYKNNFKLPKIEFELNKSNVYIFIAILLALALFLVYLKGAFIYPYFEDDDPWGHSIGTTYIAEHQTFSRYPNTVITPNNFIRTYMEPYPPAYDTLMGVLYQTNDNLMWTLKFFNVLMIALAIIFFYFFAKEFTKSEKKALFATFIIAVLPCFMSHFIWAQTLALVLFFPALYASERIKEDKKWCVLAIIATASIFVSQPSSAVFFAVMFIIYWLSKLITCYFNKEKSFTTENNLLIMSLIAGGLLSLIYWIPTFLKYGINLTMRGVGIVIGLFGAENIDTSGGIIYGIKDYMIAPLVSKMDQPTGIGIFVFFLLIFSIFILCFNIKKIKASHYLLTIIIWFVFTFIGTEGNALPFKLFPHRFWAFMAIPIAFLTAEALVSISASLKDKSLKYLVLLVLIAGILWTSGYPKYFVETSAWPPGVTWSSGEELQGYMSLQNSLPKGTKIFNPCSHEGKLLAFGMYIPPYDVDLVIFKKEIINKTLDDIYRLTKSRNLDYIAIDGYCTKKIGINQTNSLLQQMVNSTNYELTYSNQAFWLFKVK